MELRELATRLDEFKPVIMANLLATTGSPADNDTVEARLWSAVCDTANAVFVKGRSDFSGLEFFAYQALQAVASTSHDAPGVIIPVTEDAAEKPSGKTKKGGK